MTRVGVKQNTEIIAFCVFTLSLPLLNTLMPQHKCNSGKIKENFPEVRKFTSNQSNTSIGILYKLHGYFRKINENSQVNLCHQKYNCDPTENQNDPNLGPPYYI